MYYGAIVWTLIAVVLLIILFLVLRWNTRRKARLRQQREEQVQDLELNLPHQHATDNQQVMVPICPQQQHSHIVVVNNGSSGGRGHNSVHPAALNDHETITLPPPAYYQRNSDASNADESTRQDHSRPPPYKDHTRDVRYL